MKKIYYIVSLALVSGMTLSGCGKSEDVSVEDLLTETQEVMKGVEGVEVATTLELETNDSSDGKSIVKGRSQEERVQGSMKMYREVEMTVDDEPPYSEEQYIVDDGSMYSGADNEWIFFSETTYQIEDILFDRSSVYVNIEQVLSRMAAAAEASSSHVDYKEDDGVHVLTLGSMHEKLKNPETLFQVPVDISVYDLEAVINKETAIIERLTITCELSYEESGEVIDEKLILDSKISVAEDVDVKVPQEVLDAARSY
ncbi:DUF6612 family protein [Bacillus sp. FSL W7-1360]